MKGVVRRRDGARRDLVEIARYLAREAGAETARRFLAESEAAFARLAEMPGLGTRFAPEVSAMADLRCSALGRFKKYLAFYRPIDGGIEVVRVLHGSRDIPSLLAGEFEVGPGDRDDAGQAFEFPRD